MRRLLFIILVMLILASSTEGEVDAGSESVLASNNWTRQSPYTAITKPEIKWNIAFNGAVRQMVIDSKGTIFALIDEYPYFKLTAIDPNGKIKWTTTLSIKSSNRGLYLYDDKFLIVAGEGITNDSSLEYIGVLSKYTTEGELVWENKYENMRQGSFDEVSLDSDGFITFIVTYFAGTDKKNNVNTFIYEYRLIGVTSDGEMTVNKNLTLPDGSLPTQNTSPVFVKGNIYFSIFKFNKKSKNINEGYFMKYTKDGKQVFSKHYKGYNLASPVYYNNLLYVIGGNSLYMYDVHGVLKKTIFEKRGSVNNWKGPSISEQGYIYYGQRVYDSNGKLLWGFNPFGIPAESSYLATDNAVIDKKQNVIFPYMEAKAGYSSSKSGVISMNIKTKKKNWVLPLYHSLHTPVAIGKDGTLYVAGTKLFAIGQKKD